MLKNDTCLLKDLMDFNAKSTFSTRSHIMTISEYEQLHKKYWEAEYKKCQESPYYFYKTYILKGNCRFAEDEFNKEFFASQKIIPQILYV